MSVGDVRRWSPGAIDAVVGNLGSRARALVQMQGELNASTQPEAWTGVGADAAHTRRQTISEDLRRLIAQLAAVRTATATAQEAAVSVCSALAETQELAAARGFAISDDGWIRPTGTAPDDQPAITELVDRTREVLRAADDVDAQLQAVLVRAAHDEIDDGTAVLLTAAMGSGCAQGVDSRPVLPPEGGSAAANNAYWDALPDAARQQILRTRPGLVGNLDGLPAAVRDAANRARLPEEVRRAYADLPAGAAVAAPYGTGTSRDPGPDPAVTGGATPARVKLAALEAVSALPADRQLLLLDTAGTTVRAAAAVGDVDTARNVAVLVPGMSTTVQRSLLGKDGDAARLRAVSETHGGEAAAITWIGYDPPSWGSFTDDTDLTDTVTTADTARAAAPVLAQFLRGVDAARTEDPHLTVLGHSYGSLVAGLALQEGTGVDDAVFYGSPGIGTDTVGALQVRDDSVFVVEAPLDLVADADFFGPDPDRLDGVRLLSSAAGTSPDGTDRSASWGHSGYLREGTTAQYNMAAVVAGRPALTVPAGADTTTRELRGWYP